MLLISLAPRLFPSPKQSDIFPTMPCSAYPELVDSVLRSTCHGIFCLRSSRRYCKQNVTLYQTCNLRDEDANLTGNPRSPRNIYMYRCLFRRDKAEAPVKVTNAVDFITVSKSVYTTDKKA